LRVDPPVDQTRSLQHPQVTRDSRQRNRERLGEIADDGFAAREPRQNRAPRRIGEGGENRIQIG
jgi:hypothetical protein